MTFDQLTIEIEKIILSENDTNDKLQMISEVIKENRVGYDWVGFYFMNDLKKELTLGPFSGQQTDHTRIPYGRGICGQVAITGDTFIVDDVSKEENYIACSLDVKSEIVVPIYKNNQLIGQIDVDSNQQGFFSNDDQKFLKKICEMVEGLI